MNSPVERSSAPIIVASHERSGTHLLIDILRRNFPTCRATPRFGHNPHAWLYLNLDRLSDSHDSTIDASGADQTLSRADRPIIKTHMLPDFSGLKKDGHSWATQRLRGAARLYAVRDGRAVMPTYHTHSKNVCPQTPSDFSEFLRWEHEGFTPPQRWAGHAGRWMAQDDVMTVRFERMVSETAAVVAELAEFIGETPEPRDDPRPPRNPSVWGPRLARFTGRLESSNLVERGPRPKKWHELFTQDDRRFFHEHAGDRLLSLGYVQDESWIAGEDNQSR